MEGSPKNAFPMSLPKMPRVRLTDLFLLAAAGLAFCQPPAAAAAPHEEPLCGLRVYVGSFAVPNPNFPIISATLDALREKFGDEKVCVFESSTPGLIDAVKQGKAQVLISSSGMAYRLQPHGVRDLGAVMGGPVSDPNKAEGTVIAARRDREDITNVTSMKGLRLAANMREGFTGYLTGLREVADQGFNPERFFSEIFFVGHDQAGTLERLLRNESDIAFVRACTYEAIIDSDPRFRNAFKVVNPRVDPGFGCLHSTALYPAWVLSVTRELDPESAARVAEAAFSMPPTAQGLHWGVSTDYTEVDALFRKLRAGPYAFLREWTLRRVWTEYRDEILCLAVLFASLVLHSLRSRYLVRKRTRELNDAWEKERSLEAEAKHLQQRMGRMERAGVVGQMSSMIAHELGQPVSAILLYAHGLERRMEAKAPTREAVASALSKIASQAERIQRIVEKVRGYAKAREARRHPLKASELVRNAVRNFGITSAGRAVPVSLSVSPEAESLMVTGDALELELVVANLCRNASQALEGQTDPRPRIEVRVSACEAQGGGRHLLLTVADNGAPLSQAAFEALATPAESEKAEGLGLGLSICRSIVMRHGGRLAFRRGESGRGLRAMVTLPLSEGFRDEPGSADASQENKGNQGEIES